MLVPARPHGRGDRGVAQGRRSRSRSAIRTATPSSARWSPRPSGTRSRGLINKGIDEGATLVTGGPGKPEGLETGYYVKPTVFANVTNDMTIAKEEIFGPVLSILGYDTVDQAIDIGNDTEYGLAAYVSGADMAKAREVASRAARRPGLDQRRRRRPDGPVRRLQDERQRARVGRLTPSHEFLEIKAVLGYAPKQAAE